MALLSLAGTVTVTQQNPFAANRDRNFEGDSAFKLELTATPTSTAPGLLKDGLEWWCADGGWVSAFFKQNAANPWSLGPTVSTAATSTWPASDVYDPIEHVIFMAKVGDPAGALPDEWVVMQAPVAIDANTIYTGTIERKPDLLSPPQLPLPIGNPSDTPALKDPVFLAVRGPVEAYDLILPAGGGLIKKRTLVIAGQIVNWFKSKAVLDAITKPESVTGPVVFTVSVYNSTGGGRVAYEEYFNRTTRKWHRNLGKGDGNGFTLQWDDRVAAFLIHVPVPETFSFGELVLEFIWPGGAVKRSVTIRSASPDILHLPVMLGDGQTIRFGNGLSPNFNSHTIDLHQHLAYDIVVSNGDGSDASFGAPLTSVATGRVRGFHDSENDRPAGVGGSGVANRIFMEHTHVESRRYSVYAHIMKGSATRDTSTIAAGNQIAAIGNNGTGTGQHLHLAYYRLNRFGRMQMLPMAFVLRRNAASETLVGVPGDEVIGIAGPDIDRDDPIVTKLEVHITTGNRPLAGTDDDVSVTLGGRTFNLDNPGRNDFEIGNTDVFTITPWPGLRKSMLRGEIHVHKSPDGGPTGAWLLDGVKVVVNGSEMFNRQGINRWLSNMPFASGLDWRDTIP